MNTVEATVSLEQQILTTINHLQNVTVALSALSKDLQLHQKNADGERLGKSHVVDGVDIYPMVRGLNMDVIFAAGAANDASLALERLVRIWDALSVAANLQCRTAAPLHLLHPLPQPETAVPVSPSTTEGH